MSGNLNVKYQRLSQSTPSDEEDEGFEDNILFDSRLVNTPEDFRRNVFEVERLGASRSRWSNGFLYQTMSRCKLTYCVAGILISFIIGTLLTVFVLITHHPWSSGKVSTFHIGPSKEDWDQTYDNMWTESSIRLHDIDKDGLDDIVLGLADQSVMEDLLDRDRNVTVKQFCQHKGLQYPCGGTVAAVRGYDGFRIWTAPTRSVVIYQNCGDIDVNGDDIKDCIVTGRHSTCQAVDSNSGQVLWVIDPDSPYWSSHFMPEWTVYQVLIVPDLDDDEYMDILISHGGDKYKEPWDHNRQAGRLILLSGKSGLPIGKTFIELPDSKETYMPPIEYIADNGIIYVLVGSGGETIPGNLYAISLIDIYKQVTRSDSFPVGLEPIDSPDLLAQREKDAHGFITLFKGIISGVMVPPIVVDCEKDGHVDLLVSTFDGQVALLQGPSMAVKWSQTFDGMESYSSPSPGLFNEDGILDFMLHLDKGVWDRYNSSMTMILNGLDGSTLWSVEAESYAYSSDLSLHTSDVSADVFLFKLVGVHANNSHSPVIEGLMKRHMIHTQTNASFKNNDDLSAEEFQDMCNQVMSQMAMDHPVCETDLNGLTQEILLMDRCMLNAPVRIMQQKAERHHYQLSHQHGSNHCHVVSQRQKDKIDMCVVLTPTSYTGAVTDVDGDKSLDYLHVSQMTGTQLSDTLSSMGLISKVILSKHSLHSALGQKEIVHLNGNNIDDSTSLSLSSHLESLQFQSPPKQIWSQYLGSSGHSFYQRSES